MIQEFAVDQISNAINWLDGICLPAKRVEVSVINATVCYLVHLSSTQQIQDELNFIRQA